MGWRRMKTEELECLPWEGRRARKTAVHTVHISARVQSLDWGTEDPAVLGKSFTVLSRRFPLCQIDLVVMFPLQGHGEDQIQRSV